MSIAVAPLVFPHVPVAVALCWYVVYVVVVAWIALDARKHGLRWWIWFLLAVLVGPIAWLLYAAIFRRSRAATSAG